MGRHTIVFSQFTTNNAKKALVQREILNKSSSCVNEERESSTYICICFQSRSSEFEDELTWGGAWLHRATGEASYLADAEKHYETGAAWGTSWDEKNAGNMVQFFS